jgi:hypothetical protein
VGREWDNEWIDVCVCDALHYHYHAASRGARVPLDRVGLRAVGARLRPLKDHCNAHVVTMECVAGGVCGVVGEVRGAWCAVRGAWCVVRGAWCVVRGAWCVVRGAWCVVGEVRGA